MGPESPAAENQEDDSVLPSRGRWEIPSHYLVQQYFLGQTCSYQTDGAPTSLPLDGAAKVSYFLVLVLLRRLSQLVLPSNVSPSKHA